jgi:hypothetical protein
MYVIHLKKRNRAKQKQNQGIKNVFLGRRKETINMWSTCNKIGGIPGNLERRVRCQGDNGKELKRMEWIRRQIQRDFLCQDLRSSCSCHPLFFMFLKHGCLSRQPLSPKERESARIDQFCQEKRINADPDYKNRSSVQGRDHFISFLHFLLFMKQMS